MSGQREIEMTPCCTVEVRSIRKHVILFSYLYCITSFVVPVYGQLEVDSNSHSQGGNRRKLRSYLLKIGSLIKHQLDYTFCDAVKIVSMFLHKKHVVE